jgi:hypothetical protein
MKQGFGRDTSLMEAGSAPFVFFNQKDREVLPADFKGGFDPARAGADHDIIKRVVHNP